MLKLYLQMKVILHANLSYRIPFILKKVCFHIGLET